MKTAQQIAQEWQMQMNDPRIKCPNCGSSAQPELVYLDHTSNSTRKIDEYECGCGQRFEVIFDMSCCNLLKEEN